MSAQGALCMVTMAFTVVAFVFVSCVRQTLPGVPGPFAYRILCAVIMIALVLSLRWVRTPFMFGAVGVMYILVLVLGLSLDIVAVDNPLWWALPSAMVIPICAAPLWLTPTHYVIGTGVFYLAGGYVVRQMDLDHDAVIVCLLWLVIGISTSAVFKFGFYRFRMHHYLLQEELIHLASMDALVGLPNRQAFIDRVRERLIDKTGSSASASLIVLGIDHMTSINEQYGHATGDETLRTVADVLKALGIIGMVSIVGRLDGKKFGIFVTGLKAGDVFEIGDDLRRRIAVIPRPDGFLTASLGIAESLPGDTVMSLIDRADEALLRAKRMGRDRVVVAQKRIDSIEEPIETAAPLSLEPQKPPPQWGDNTLLSHFQPLFSLSHHKAVGFEALLRGKSRSGDIVGPMALFKSAPDTAGDALDRLTHALHLSTAKAQLPEGAWLFINMLPGTFVQPSYVEQLCAVVRRAGLLPSNIVLEILESQDGDIRALADAAARYRDAGFLIAIDDFGAGHSNIDRLLQIQPDVVKLDGTLIRAKCRTTYRPLLPNLVSLLHSAGMLVVVEGVETNEELVLAVDANVDLVQGYLLGRPGVMIDQSEVSALRVKRAFDVASETRNSQHHAFEARLTPYLEAVREAATLLANGSKRPVDTILNALDLCSGCYLLDDAGRPFEHEAISTGSNEKAPRFPPLSSAHDVRWDNKPYFMHALASPGIPIYSEPFMSLTSGRSCVAIACAIRLEQRCVVLVAKLDWASPQLPWPNVGVN